MANGKSYVRQLDCVLKVDIRKKISDNPSVKWVGGGGEKYHL